MGIRKNLIPDSLKVSRFLCGVAIIVGALCRLTHGAAAGADQLDRDNHVPPMYEFTCRLATLEPPPEMQQLLGAMRGNQETMDGFVRTMAGTIFLSPENIDIILAATRRTL